MNYSPIIDGFQRIAENKELLNKHKESIEIGIQDYDSEKNSVSAFVQGSELYETSVIFDKNGNTRGYRCDCPYGGLCKHVVALMLEIADKDEDDEFDEAIIKEDLHTYSIFDIFGHNSEEAKTQVYIEATITFDGTGSAVSGDCGCGTTIVSYEWDFGDSETASGSIVNHSYDTADTYTVTLTVKDSNGKSAVTSVTVTVS